MSDINNLDRDRDITNKDIDDNIIKINIDYFKQEKKFNIETKPFQLKIIPTKTKIDNEKKC